MTRGLGSYFSGISKKVSVGHRWKDVLPSFWPNVWDEICIIIYSNLYTGCITQLKNYEKKKKVIFLDLTFFFSCKNQELASFEKLLMEKLSNDIIYLALKCHLEIKHEDALFRKHQNNLFQRKKKPAAPVFGGMNHKIQWSPCILTN